jgi:hypothetical protein
MSRRPPRTLVSGLGVASAVLAGVLVAIALAAGMIEFHGPDGRSDDEPAAALRVEGRAQPAPRRRVVRRRATVRAPARTVRRAKTAERRSPPRPTVVRKGATVQSPLPLLPPPPVAAAAAPPPPPPPAAPPRSRAPLEPLGAGVQRTTDGLAGSVRDLTQDLGDGVSALSPPLDGLVAGAGDTLGDVVEGAGDLLARVLGHQPMP